MLKTFMAGALIVAAALPVNAQVTPQISTQDMLVARAGNGYVCTREFNGRLSLRIGPGQSFAKIKEIRNGDNVLLLSRAEGRDGYTWWYVRHNRNRGWVRADFICS
ncbi:SH3 domain-containing protein [Calothrix sp. 336/3]|uniref:SH3 domain-containing protein n=1 Tax=Calothrix sp. 336/3 TaxID=1337936 RepID=UPI0004E42C1F|nr:SH3 domain-containing protein [Calothrix sp. 336/3]AKG21009.1 hypothetical protein IJ00_06590 [Calothrix sp. 336/3]